MISEHFSYIIKKVVTRILLTSFKKSNKQCVPFLREKCIMQQSVGGLSSNNLLLSGHLWVSQEHFTIKLKETACPKVTENITNLE